jgi:hypothetical protein
MKLHRRTGLIGLALLAGLVFALALVSLVGAGRAGIAFLATQVDNPAGGERQREAPAPELPSISFIDSPTAACVRPKDRSPGCFVQWSNLGVSAGSSQYIISMTVQIDGRFRAYYSGFFQNAMNVPPEMYSPGFRVACGVEGSGGVPGMGRAYAYTLRARETGGLGAANFGTVICPAETVGPYLVFLPNLKR